MKMSNLNERKNHTHRHTHTNQTHLAEVFKNKVKKTKNNCMIESLV